MQHYPVMNEQQLAVRWDISTKTLRRWRAEKIGPVYRKLGQLVRYFEDDVQEFERRSARHWMSMLGRDESQPIVLTPQNQADQAEDDSALPIFIDAKKAAEITGLGLHLFADRNERDRKRLPYLSLIGNVRYSLDEIYQWEQANAVPAFGPGAPQLPAVSVETPSPPTGPAPRWYEIVREQDGERFDSEQSSEQKSAL